jgi:hypothetical protein
LSGGASRGVANGVACYQPLWAWGETGTVGWESAAARAFEITGVPTAVLIDRHGRLLWRGHPAAGPDQKDQAARLEEVVEK